jgi:two-component system, NarL family, sensor histidine kinase UhpB
LRQAHALLEARVAERTAELARTNQSLLEQIAERKSAEQALRHSEQQLREVLAERERLARDLHDNIVQVVYAIGMRLEESQRLINESPTEAAAQLANAIAGLNGVIRDVRRYIAGAGPGVVSGRQLGVELARMAEALESKGAPRFQLDIDPAAAERLTPEEAENILQIAREALSNSIRHAHSRNATLTLRFEDGGVRLEVSDDGVGFDPYRPRQEGSGLHNMESRAQELGAPLEVRSAPKAGTRIIARIPKKHGIDDIG